jgi:hypothetical protein
MRAMSLMRSPGDECDACNYALRLRIASRTFVAPWAGSTIRLPDSSDTGPVANSAPRQTSCAAVYALNAFRANAFLPGRGEVHPGIRIHRGHAGFSAFVAGFAGFVASALWVPTALPNLCLIGSPTYHPRRRR